VGNLDLLPTGDRIVPSAIRDATKCGAGGPAHFGMVRMYMTLAEEEPAVSVFRDPADAHRWLAERGHGPA